MPKIPEFDDHDADTDLFFSKEFGDDTMWSIHPDISAVTPGDGAYTILASDISGAEADMIEYRPLSFKDVLLSDGVDSESFRYRFFGIKYTAGTATGTLNMYLHQKKDN